MKVLFVCAAGLVGGKERQTLESMRGLRDLGHDVFCVTSSWNTGEFEKLLGDHNIPYSPLRLGFISKQGGWSSMKMTLHQLIYVPSLLFRYRSLLSRVKPCVVVHSNFQHIFLLMPVLGSVKNVFHVHDVFSNNKFFRRLFKIFRLRIERFAGVSNFVCDRLQQLGVPKERIDLVYNSVRPPSVIHTQQNDIATIGIVGQIGSWKGHEVLLSALSLIRDVPWRLNIIGFGSEEYIAKLRSIAAKYGIDDRMTFKGKIEGLVNIYHGIDIACVPSTISESFGLSAAEPGFFGIPAVVSNLGGLPEIVVDGKTGLVVPVNDATALAEGLRVLLSQPLKRKQFGDAAREHVNRLFSIANNATRMESLLKSLCDR
jgi:glycosyltransferase involved in cell wall biosynthesis